MRSGAVIRPWQLSDNDQLVRIARDLVLPARVRFGIDRAPEFAAFGRRAGERFEILVAEQDGVVAGFLELRYLRFILDGESVSGAYFALAAVSHERRGQGVFGLLSAEGERIARASDARIGIGLINDHNTRLVRHFQKRRRDAVLARHLAVSSLVIGPRYPTGRDFSYGPASEPELPGVAGLVRRCHGEYLLSHEVNVETLRRLQPDNLLVARDGSGRTRACVGLWNQHDLRRVIVHSYAPTGNILRHAMNVTRRLTGIAAMPAPDEELKVVHAIHAAAEPGFEGAFAGLLRHALNRQRGLGVHLMLISLPDGDRLEPCLSGLLRIPGGNIPLLFARDDLRPRLAAAPPGVRFEYALA